MFRSHGISTVTAESTHLNHSSTVSLSLSGILCRLGLIILHGGLCFYSQHCLLSATLRVVPGSVLPDLFQYHSDFTVPSTCADLRPRACALCVNHLSGQVSGLVGSTIPPSLSIPSHFSTFPSAHASIALLQSEHLFGEVPLPSLFLGSFPNEKTLLNCAMRWLEPLSLRSRFVPC